MNKEEIDMNRTFKLNFERLSLDHPDTWFPSCMNSFGRGYSFREAETIKKHLESKEGIRNVQIVPMEDTP